MWLPSSEDQSVAPARSSNLIAKYMYFLALLFALNLIRTSDFIEVHNTSAVPSNGRDLVGESFGNESPSRLSRFASEETNLYFIHVGKAGGMSLNKKFRTATLVRRLPCYMNATNTRLRYRCNGRGSAFRRHLLGRFHMGNVLYSKEQRKWLQENTNLLVFSVRDPVDRIVSAFNYHYDENVKRKSLHPEDDGKYAAAAAKFYLDCFPDVEHLALSQTASDASRFSSSCRRLGRATLQGSPARRGSFSHFRYNYQYYTRSVWSDRNKPIAVIRTEALWTDVARIEGQLGGDPRRFLGHNEPLKITHGSESFERKSGVSNRGAIAICCTIRKEMQVYHDLIAAAVNLNTEEKQVTLRRLFDHCDVADRNIMSPETFFAFQWESWHHAQCS